MGICYSQMKYGTVSVEKGTCGAAPARGRGQMEEMGVSWPTCPGQDVYREGKVLWDQPVLQIPPQLPHRNFLGLGCCQKKHGGAAGGALWEGACGFHVQLHHIP